MFWQRGYDIRFVYVESDYGTSNAFEEKNEVGLPRQKEA